MIQKLLREYDALGTQRKILCAMVADLREEEADKIQHIEILLRSGKATSTPKPPTLPEPKFAAVPSKHGAIGNRAKCSRRETGRGNML